MIKNDISKILKEGSIKQRIKMLSEHYANLTVGGKGILSDKETRELSDSFKTSPEINAFNKMNRAFRDLRPALLALNQYRVSFRHSIATITGYVLLWESYKETEELLNSTLWEVKDKKLRKELSTKLSKNSNYIFTEVELQTDDTLIFRTDSPRRPRRGIKKKDFIEEADKTLEGIIHLWKENAELNIIQVKSYVKAITDWMEERDFKPKPFKDLLNQIMDDIYADYAPYPKYSKSQMTTIKGGLDISIMEKYFVYPEPDEIEPDENLCKAFREGYLND